MPFVFFHSVIHGLGFFICKVKHSCLSNKSGHFTPAVALKYYATRKISARIIRRASRKEVTIYNTKRAADCLQEVVIALSLKEGPHMLLWRLSNQSKWSVWTGELDLSYQFSFFADQKILQISDLIKKFKKASIWYSATS